MTPEVYTTQLQAGLGLIEETRKLLAIWSPGMSAPELNRVALESGQFPNMTSRRLHNLVTEGFKPRFLLNHGAPAIMLQKLDAKLSRREFNQLLFLYTCRANLVLADFVCQVYWAAYRSGRGTVEIEDARRLIEQANQAGKTFKPWSAETVKRVSRYLPACCADFGLLETGGKSIRKILPFQIESTVMGILAYDLHCSGYGDNSILSHSDWMLFGMARGDVLNEFKRQALKGWWILQSAGDVTRIGWQYQTMEEMIHGLAQG